MEFSPTERAYLETQLRTAPMLSPPEPKPSFTQTGQHHALIQLEGVAYQVLGKPAYEVVPPRRPPMSLAQAEQMTRNEEAAYLVAKALGPTHLVPITVTRYVWWPSLGRQALASLQITWSNQAIPSHPMFKLAPESDRFLAGLFDGLTLQGDRWYKTGANWAIEGVKGPEPRLRLFDNGLTFGLARQLLGISCHSVFTDEYLGHPLGPWALDALVEFASDPPPGLLPLIGDMEHEELLARTDKMITARALVL